ncbi:MAG: hypothetical protein ACI865_000444 [Flavobacteriaceae bacterium]|jgi:hypothetical protein
MRKIVIPAIVKKINRLIDSGNQAIKHGNQSESISCYLKALSLSIEAKDKSKEREISELIITLM